MASLLNPMLAPTLGEGFILVSFWKPVLLILPFLGWAWLVSVVLDKHAARFHLARAEWNLVHLIVALVAIGIAVLMPVENQGGFWAGFGALILILVLDIVVFAMVTNRDDRVPEKFHLRLSMDSLKEARTEKKAAKQLATAQLNLKGPSGTVPVPNQDTPEFEVRTAGEQVYIKGIEARAARMDIAPTGKNGTYGVSYVVDGLRQGAETMPGPEAVKIIDMWKAAAGMDTTDRRRRLIGELKVEQEGDAHSMRLTSIGTQAGPRLSMLVDPRDSVTRSVEDLGLLDRQREELDAIVQDGTGVVLLGAGPMSGRTTTMYTIIGCHDAYTQNIQTAELDILADIEGVRQTVFDPRQDGPDHATTVRSMLRRDPDVVAVADIMDADTAREIAKADHERTRVYVGVKADDALTAVKMWVKGVGDAEQGAGALRGVLCQKLVRTLCTNCRVAYQPSPDMLKKLGLPADKVPQLFKQGGQVLIKNKPDVCPVCKGGGYFGQIGVFEVYKIGDAERAAIKGGNLADLRTELRKRQLPNLQQAALRRAVEGVTSIDEVLRVTAGKQPQAKAQAQPAS